MSGQNGPGMASNVSRLDILEETQGSFGAVITLLIDGVDLLGGDDDHYGGSGWRREQLLTANCPSSLLQSLGV
jgi:hypothetical protein